MERLALRAVLLTVVAANVFRSEASGLKAEPDFTVTITEKGVQEDMQQFFSLGPSATLRVVDESNSAILLPQAEGGEAQDSVAYEFENGHCNFGKTVAYKDMFSGYTQQVWARSPAEAGTGEKHGGKTSIYTFTNPPVEYLNGGVSFCVRFMTKTTVTTNTTTTTPTTTTAATAHSSAPTGGSSSDSTGGEGSSPTPGDSDAPEPGTGSGGGSSSGESESQPDPPPSNQPSEEELPGVPSEEEGGDGDSAQEGGHNSGNDPQHGTGSSSNGAEAPEQQQQPQQTDSQSVQPQLGHSDHVLLHNDGANSHATTESSDPGHEQVPSTEGKLQSSQLLGPTASQGAPLRNSDPFSVGRMSLGSYALAGARVRTSTTILR
ncbi:Toxoplasma gondii family A protein [Toxoplasma gondii VEG]|uniref:Toxoplasma gondii family A protein n=1 Tax=Toxoplasma gondii (strain ATCC 50861 / VEG) TaxID=432359 RepID=V4ZCD9_TOXGV|nr:Toxoplasma gondii family A protein [Toxoplasma gondii VEG]